MSWRPHPVLFALSLALAPAACGGDDGDGGTPDANPNADGSAADAAVATSCSDPGVTIDTQTTFVVDDVTGIPILHPYAAFDGDAVWLAYTGPDDDGSPVFDTYAVRIGCDGGLLAGPLRVTTRAGVNEIDPAIAVSGDTVLVTWVSDDGVGPNNLDLVARRLSRDGTFIDAADGIVETTRDGDQAPGNVLMADVTAMPGGEFAIAAARGLESASAFQAVAQRIGTDGVPVGDAVDGEFGVQVSQLNPAIAVRADGSALLAWTSEPLGGTAEVRIAAIDADFSAAGAPVSPFAGVSGRPFLAAHGAGAEERVYLALDADTGPANEIIVRDARTDVTTAAEARFGGTGTNVYPVLATRDGGGAVVFHKLASGARTDVYAAAFSFDGTAFAAGAEVKLNTERSASVYAPAIAHVQGDIYFVSWTEGPGSDFNNYGRFVELSAP